MQLGRGVCAVVDGKRILAGNIDMISENKIACKTNPEIQGFLNSGSTVTYIAAENEVVGYLILSDTIRKESGAMLNALQSCGVQPVLLTGDNENSANSIAKQLNINEVYANCLPEDKLKLIEKYQEDEQPVCMIGDGINDAPASVSYTHLDVYKRQFIYCSFQFLYCFEMIHNRLSGTI